jgi:diguanylate cyclase (GGDEF)-like protein
MHNFDTLLETLKKNEEIANKFHEIEIKILAILNFTDLFEVLLTEIKEKFQVPYVWLTFIEAGEVPYLIGQIETSTILKAHLNIVPQDIFYGLMRNSTKPLLVNDNLKPFFKLLPPHRKCFMKSMAIAPIMIDGRIIGSLNQADFSHARFSPDIDTSLLERLAIKVSLCLANVIAHEKLKFLAYHDPLTGLLNRRVMESILKREFQRARRYNTHLSLVFLDVDDFKGTNDTYGHDIGDQLLAYLSRQLCLMVRESDVVARFAGDEFVIILPETPDEHAIDLMIRIQAHFQANPLNTKDDAIPVSISFGVSSNQNKKIANTTDLLKEADNALYQMKAVRKKKPLVSKGLF